MEAGWWQAKFWHFSSNEYWLNHLNTLLPGRWNSLKRTSFRTMYSTFIGTKLFLNYSIVKILISNGLLVIQLRHGANIGIVFLGQFLRRAWILSIRLKKQKHRLICCLYAFSYAEHNQCVPTFGLSLVVWIRVVWMYRAMHMDGTVLGADILDMYLARHLGMYFIIKRFAHSKHNIQGYAGDLLMILLHTMLMQICAYFWRDRAVTIYVDKKRIENFTSCPFNVRVYMYIEDNDQVQVSMSNDACTTYVSGN